MSVSKTGLTVPHATLTLVGYWFNPHAPSRYPDAAALTGAWHKSERTAVLAHLRNGSRWQRFASASFCRFGCKGACGRDLLTDGVYAWPSGLAHYLDKHQVQLPRWFVRHVLTQLRRSDAAHRNPTVARAKPHPRAVPPATTRLSDARWLAWAKSRGASLPLPPQWELPGAQDRRKIGLALSALGRGVLPARLTVLLARADTRTVIGSTPDARFIAVRTTQQRVRAFATLREALRWANR